MVVCSRITLETYEHSLRQIFFDEKDVFTFFFGVFLLVAMYLRLPLLPFRVDSLVVLFVFMLIGRTMVSSIRYEGYFMIGILGLLFSLFLSPYGLAIYLFIAMLIYMKTQRV